MNGREIKKDLQQVSRSYGFTASEKHEVVVYEYRGYTIREEYGGFGVSGTMFDELADATDWVDRQLDGETVEGSVDGYGKVTI